MVFCLNGVKKRNKLVSKNKIFLCLFYINEKSIDIENDKKRENNERQNQRVAASKTKRIRSSDARSVVTQKETSVGIRSSVLTHSEVLQKTLEGKKTKVLGGVQTVSKKS